MWVFANHKAIELFGSRVDREVKGLDRSLLFDREQSESEGVLSEFGIH